MLLEQLDFIERQVQNQEERLEALITVTQEMQLLQSLPGVGKILSAVIALEVGDITRFGDAEGLASYAGTVPRVPRFPDRIGTPICRSHRGRKGSLWAVATGRQPLPEVGFRGGGQFRGAELLASARTSPESPLLEDSRTSRPPEGNRRSRQASG